MSKEFIEKGLNSDNIRLAVEQQSQLSYFTESDIQENILTPEYISNWASRKYQTDDYFLNFIKSIFKEENFLLFTKYLRFPLPSSKIVKNEIEPNLRKVLYAENATFEHVVRDVTKEEVTELLNSKSFTKELFNHLLYRHNDLLVEDSNENGAYRYFLDIDLVKSIHVIDGKVIRIAFGGSAIIKNTETGEPEEKEGTVYIDDKVYALYNEDLDLVDSHNHDLGRCPVDFISDVRFKNNDVVRESTFTFIREELEEYVFLKTLQKVTDPNGAFPIVTMLGSDDDGLSDTKGQSSGEPRIEDSMSSQQADVGGSNPPKGIGSDLQAGSVVQIKPREKLDGSIDIDVVTNYITFHHIPVAVLENIDTRITNIEKSIITTIIGDVVSSNEASKNETQINMGVSTLENQLVSLSEKLDRIRSISDTNMLELQYPGRVQKVFIHYGTDFYLDSIYKMMQEFKEAPNPIERKDILIRVSQSKYKNNEGKKARQKILYDLMPYSADIDFDRAVSSEAITEENLELYLRFNFWISTFEAQYGDIVEFAMSFNGSDEQRLNFITKLLKALIKPELNDRKREDDTRTD